MSHLAARRRRRAPHAAARSVWQPRQHGLGLSAISRRRLAPNLFFDSFCFRRRAVRIVQGRREADRGLGQGVVEEVEEVGADERLAILGHSGLPVDAASGSMSWHAAEGAVALLPPRGRYA